MPEKVAMKMLRDRQMDYEKFISLFFVKYGKLQIEGYHHSSRAIRKKPIEVKVVSP